MKLNIYKTEYIKIYKTDFKKLKLYSYVKFQKDTFWGILPTCMVPQFPKDIQQHLRGVLAACLLYLSFTYYICFCVSVIVINTSLMQKNIDVITRIIAWTPKCHLIVCIISKAFSWVYIGTTNQNQHIDYTTIMKQILTLKFQLWEVLLKQWVCPIVVKWRFNCATIN